MKRPVLRSVGVLILLWLWGALIYAHTLNGEFQFDDQGFIEANTTIHDLGNLGAIWKGNLSQPSRFIGLLSFALNYHFHQLDVRAYHITNLGIHLLTATMVWWLTLLLWPLLVNSIHKKSSPFLISIPPALLAFIPAFIFVSHPVQTQAISYISQRFASLATLFYVTTVCLYLKGRLSSKPNRRRIYWGGAMLMALMGMFTKEIVITLPLMLVAFEMWWVRPWEKVQDCGCVSTNRNCWSVLSLFKVLIFGSFFLIIPALFSFRLINIFQLSLPSQSHPGDVFNLWTYFLTQIRVLVVFLRLCFLPIGQNLDYDFSMTYTFWDSALWVSGVVMGVVIYVCIRWRRRWPYLSVGMMWFFMALLANFVPRAHVIFEHKLYLASIGFCMALGMGLVVSMKSRVKLWGAVISVVLVLGLITVQRNRVWGSDVHLWQDVLRKSPHKIRPYINLAEAYRESGRYVAATQLLNRAVFMDPRNKILYNNRGTIYESMNQPERALADFQQSLYLDPSFYQVYNNRGVLYKKQRKYALALQDFNRSIELKPNYAQAYNNRGDLYQKHGQYTQALADLNKALELNPLFVGAYSNRGNVYQRQQLWDQALQDYNKALRISPDLALLYNNRGSTYMRQGRDQDALADFQQALRLKPAYIEALSNQGAIYQKLGQYDLALAAYNQAVNLNAEVAELFYNRARVYRARQEMAEALRDYTQAIGLKPYYVKAYKGRGQVYGYLGQHDLAIADFDQALVLERDDKEAQRLRAVAQQEKMRQQ